MKSTRRQPGISTATASPDSSRDTLLAELIKLNGQDWVDQHKELLDEQADWIDNL